MAERHEWLQRWQQTEDDELLYVDQALVMPEGLTLEEQRHLAETQEAQGSYDASLDD